MQLGVGEAAGAGMAIAKYKVELEMLMSWGEG